SAILISKFVQEDSGSGDTAAKSNIQIANPDELPQNAVLMFSLKAETPEKFSRAEKIEVATADGSYSTMLTLANGLTLQDQHTAVAKLVPAKAFGTSAFGALRFRVVTDNGVSGDWQPLATLVRLPSFDSLQCSDQPQVACKLRGSNLFLVDSIAQTQQFTAPVQVPDGFPGRVLPVPHPLDGGELYVKLRDDPSVVNLVTLAPDIAGGKKNTEKQDAAQSKFRPAYASPANSAPSDAATRPNPTANSPAQDASHAAPPSTAAPQSTPAAPTPTPAPAAKAPATPSTPHSSTSPPSPKSPANAPSDSAATSSIAAPASAPPKAAAPAPAPTKN
ncbi:MAG: hypothetical protein ACRD3F_12100, partial [Acidobacteriaceae bacterium]